jgi:hypothetical protein
MAKTPELVKAEYLQARQAGRLDVQPLIFSESWNFGNLGVWPTGICESVDARHL